MINVLFSPSEIKKLKKHLENQKANCTNKEKIEPLNGLYKALSNIELSNTKSDSKSIRMLK